MNFRKFLPDTVFRKAYGLLQKLWVRVAAMGLLAVLVLGLTVAIEQFVPEKIGTRLTGEAADRLLQIIASAMLAVTTFSLSVMVALYRSSSTQWTPRVHRLIITDPVTQNTLAVFIGAYVYALTGIILRELGVFGDERSLVLFITTVLVLVLIVYSLIRWVLHLQTFGSLMDTTRQVEEITGEQFRERLELPCLGGTPWVGDVPNGARRLMARTSGYITQIFPETLDAEAERHGVRIYLSQVVGSYVFEGEPLAMVVEDGEPEEGCGRETLEDAVHEAVQLGEVRSYGQDPRFGLIVMGEIASKALSPGINDPGTAIDVIMRAARILRLYRDETEGEGAPEYPRLFVRPIRPGDLIEDAFGALARDGAGVLEVQQRLQKALAALSAHPDAGLSRAALDAAALHYMRAEEALTFAPDRARLAQSTAPEVRAAAAAQRAV